MRFSFFVNRRREENKMRLVTVSGLAALIGAIAVSPAIAQAEGDDASAPSYRSLMPLQIDINKFELVGSSEFGVGADEHGSVEGWLEHDFDTVALMPIDNMAACSGLTLTYSSGETEEYPLLAPGLLSHKQIYQIMLCPRKMTLNKLKKSQFRCGKRCGPLPVKLAKPSFSR